MIRSDPRKKDRKPILLGGEDAMDEDEDVDMPTPTTLPETTSNELISRIVVPSPYPQHNAGPTSSRFRNALNRVTTHPMSDVEAWQALMTEVNTCYRNIPSVHSVDAETHAKLDWVESCYGTLLKYFPYASAHYVSIIEMLMTQSARVGEEGGPLLDRGMDTSRRARQCEAKLENLFRRVLGIEMDGTVVDDPIGGMCVWTVELWLLYIRKCERDAHRKAATMPPDDRAGFVREAAKKAYEIAISHAGFSHDNHLLWKQYLDFCRSWIPDPANNTDHALAQQQMVQLRAVYQRLVTHPMTGLDQFWQEYEAFERGQSEALAQALTQEFAPKYQHARTVYLERNRIYSSIDLQLGRLATPPADESEEDYATKLEEEYNLLKLWKKRCSYERTNPERLASSDLAQRIRCAYKEMASVLTRHPECWHMWSMWELLGPESHKTEQAIVVLQLGQKHIPDCTLLAHAESQIVELHTEQTSDCLPVMERFLERSPNTLGFVLYQQMVRRYKGIEDARGVFAKARRILADAEKVKETGENEEEAEVVENEGEKSEMAQPTSKSEENSGKKWMVTNRLDPSIGRQHSNVSSENPKKEEVNGDTIVAQADKITQGPITWHLYASHANIEHRLNRCPEVAARVYELGLRKHASFLTKPPYVMRYAQLLLELGDTMNLRALLTRAVAACEAQEKEDALAALWDMTLYFESLMSGSDQSSVSELHKIERRRREALMGPDVEDVASGGFLGVGDNALVGAQKSTIAEQLVTSEGYDMSSGIVNGMNRAIDLLETMGLWGSGESEVATIRRRMKQTSNRDRDDISGGKSDISYQKRQHFEMRYTSGLTADSAGAEAGTGSKILSARERLQQGGAGAAAATGPSTAMTLAIQQSPEWLRPLLLLLPASRLRLPVVAKPPPHLTEMALSALRQNDLPSQRPADDTVAAGSKRKAGDAGGDSSDEENGGTKGGGYGSQFRSRQRARMTLGQNGTDHN